MPTDLKGLIERVEGGDGADRELDAAVAVALDGTAKSFTTANAPDRTRAGYGTGKWFTDADNYHVLSGTVRTAPFWTSSLDAVLALIEAKLPGWCWQVKRGIGCEAIVWQICKDYDDEGCRTIGHHTESASRALLAAALRAIQDSRHAD